MFGYRCREVATVRIGGIALEINEVMKRINSLLKTLKIKINSLSSEEFAKNSF